jgi:hypothetical protein
MAGVFGSGGAKSSGSGGSGLGSSRIYRSPTTVNPAAIMGGFGGGAPGFAGFMGGGGNGFSGNLNLSSTVDPRMNSIIQMPPELAKQLSEENTKNLVTTAGARIGESAAGELARAKDAESMGGGEANPRAIEEARQRRVAGATAGITADRAAAKDALATTAAGLRQHWTDSRDSLLTSAGGVASGISGDLRAQQGLQLQGYQAANSNAMQQMQMLMSLFGQLYS